MFEFLISLIEYFGSWPAVHTQIVSCPFAVKEYVERVHVRIGVWFGVCLCFRLPFPIGKILGLRSLSIQLSIGLVQPTAKQR